VDIKDLILIGGGLLITAVVAHGLWIAWRARQDPLRLKIEEKLIAAVADRDPVQTDFPNGGARVVSQWDVERDQDALEFDDDAAALERAAAERLAAERVTAERRASQRLAAERATVERRAAERDATERTAAERTVPRTTSPRSESAKTEPLIAPSRSGREPAVREGVAAPTRSTREFEPRAPAAGEARSEIRAREATPAKVEATLAKGEAPPAKVEATVAKSEAAGAKNEGLRAGVARRAQEAFKALGNRPAPKAGTGAGRGAGSGGAAAGAAAGQAGNAAESPPEDLILINLLAPNEQPFTGPNLVDALRSNGLRYGDMNIFHRIDATTKAHQYSVANIIEPGTFDMAEVEEFRTPGVCFFMRLPGPEHPLEAFEDMHRVARDVAQRLGGELKDERRSVLTGQTVEHYRHRVAEFCRRRMSIRA